MHIKQVTIQGFKSYKNETVCEPFSPKHNVIVGRNGSGKSNFFFAIRFVLSDMYTSLSNQERAKLLHGEGIGMSVMSAYVEMVFDNSDNRIPIEREEVTLRRSIGLKKDEYFLDSKHVTKQEVMNLLESSGFSRSNPYYIVQQGKIMQLATMKDGERLNLLKEVAGTKVYDDRRVQSLQILEDTTTKKERIEEVLAYIEERLAELEDEKDELKEYQELDRSKRAIEYTIYDKELRNARDALEKLDAERQTEVIRREKSHESLEDEEKISKGLSEELAKLQNEIARMKRERSNIEGDRKEALKEHAKLELDVEEIQGAVGKEKETGNRIKSELKKIQQQIKDRRAEVVRLTPEVASAAEDASRLQAQLETAKARQQDIFSKETRTSQFASEEERDAWIDEEIKSLRSVQTKKAKNLKQSEADIARLTQDLETANEDMEERVQQVAERKKRIETINVEFRESKARKDGLTNERKKLWAEDAKLDGTMADLKADLTKAERSLYQTTSKAKAKGLEVVEQLRSEPGFEGIYGTLVDLIDCPTDYRVPVEVTAMDSLFNVVVQDDTVASKIIDYINRKKIEARVTCLPLNRLRQDAPRLPKGKDFIAMVKKIDCEDAIRPAVNHIFGKTLICRDLEVAAHYANEQNIDAVTLDGDKVSKKGSMHGGFYDERTGKIELAGNLRKYSKEFTEAEDKSRKIKLQVTDIGQKITQEMSAHQKLESEKERLRKTYEDLQVDEGQQRDQAEKAKEQMAAEQETCTRLKTEIAANQEQIDTLATEKGTSLDSQLDDDSRQELAELQDEIAQLGPQIATSTKTKADLVQQKERIERQLKLNLEKQEKKLVRQQEEYVLSDRKMDLEVTQGELVTSKAQVDESNAKYRQLEELLQAKQKDAAEISASLDEAKAEERKRMTTDANNDKRLEKIINKRKMHFEKQEELVRKIRDLGALPKNFEDYHQMELKKLFKQLTGVNKKLKDPKYRQVNKKALDQYVSFSEQRDALVNRKDDQDSADQSILDLIQVLDGQKDEAIERTFKQVSLYFSEVFRELVPGGKGNLVMQKRDILPAPSEMEDEDSDEASAANLQVVEKTGRIEQYVGVAVRVTFTGKSDETHLLQQLSGGQRTIVALALIFAIQRCDPAPFYLFDEIDAALDAAHRTAVAEMIDRLKENAQFIVTTFRPEMLQKADRFYGVSYKNKVSRIDTVSLDTAMDFIEDDATGK